MYRGLRSLNCATMAACIVTALIAVAHSRPAQAADKKVVLEQFTGAGASKYRDQVKKALQDLKIEVVSDKKLAATEADLGLMQASDSYGAVAAQLGASHFISGSTGGKKPTATLFVKDSSGKRVGQKVFRAKKPKQLSAALAKQLRGALAELLGKGGDAAVAVDSATEPAAKEEVKAKAQAEPAAAEKKPAVREEKRAEKRAAEPSPAPAARVAKKSTSAARSEEKDDEDDEDEDGDADTTVTASASGSSGFGSGWWKGLDASVGAYIYSRKFAYKQETAGNQEAYNTNPVAPAIAANVDYFFLPYVGASLGGDFTFALTSVKDDATFSTSAMSFYVGPKGKVNLGPLEVNLLAAFAKQTFKLQERVEVDDQEFFSNVPAADYSMLRAVLGARLDLRVVTVFGSFGYNHILSMGSFADAFPNATAAATEGSLGVSVPLAFLLNGLDVRAAFFGRAFGIAMNSDSDDPNRAGGATDRYMGGLLSVGYRTN